MGHTHDAITEEFAKFIGEQPMFFVASAAREGRVNVSPKGINEIRVLGERRVAYLDYTGSGAETAAHLIENGRLTIMFCSFGQRPLILRLYGQGRGHLPGTPGWDELAPQFEIKPGARQIVELNVDRVQTSCGFGVPRMELIEQRTTLLDWAEKKGEEGLREYRALKNMKSIDGLPTPFASQASHNDNDYEKS